MFFFLFVQQIRCSFLVKRKPVWLAKILRCGLILHWLRLKLGLISTSLYLYLQLAVDCSTFLFLLKTKYVRAIVERVCCIFIIDSAFCV